MILCAEINPDADTELRDIAANEVVFEVRTGAVQRARLPGTCGQNGVPIKILSDPGKCIDNDRIVAKVCGANAGFADIAVLSPTETESRLAIGGRVDGVFIYDPRCGPPGTRCATEDYLVTFTRAPASIDLFNQTYLEVVSQSRPLGIFCSKDYQTGVQRQKEVFRFGDHQNTITDIVGVTGKRDLIDQEKIDWVRMTQRPLKCGAEVLQHFKINACRVPREPSKSIRQRTQFVLAPFGGISFTTSRSDEKIPHGNLDSQ